MLRLVLILALFAFSASVYADGFNYNSVTASYGQIDFDNLNADGDSLGISASAEVGESFFVFGGYGVADISDSVISVDVDSWDVGVGYHMPMSDSVDFVASLSYEYIDISVPGFGSVDDHTREQREAVPIRIACPIEYEETGREMELEVRCLCTLFDS